MKPIQPDVAVGRWPLVASMPSNVRSLLLTTCLLLAVVYLVSGDGACFRRYDPQIRACKGLIFSRSTDDVEPALCCGKHGQGYAKTVVRVENRKKWYECESCKGLDESLRGGRWSSEEEKRKRDQETDEEIEMEREEREEEMTMRRSGTSERERINSQETESLEGSKDEEEAGQKRGREEEREEEQGEATIRPEQLNSVESNKTRGPVDWSPWSDWSPCSHSCGVGVQKRRRFCLDVSCGEEFEERACHKILNCPVDGGWNDWTDWTSCTVLCGNGTRNRVRSCLNPPPAHGGMHCVGSSMETELCFLPPCKVDGAWSSWSLWSVCSVTCGLGEQVRTRTCDEPSPAHGGRNCDGEAEERRQCHNLPCPVDGDWSNWSKWSNCSASCGEGIQTRSRICDNPVPDNGGQTCDGLERESMSCVTRINCPVDGNWTEWSRWDICSARPCSGQLGHRVRYRTCTNPRPMFGGRTCRGRTWSRQACYNNEFCIQPVEGGWCEWVEWSPCSVGLQTRSRLCECPPPVNGGQDCTGINVEEKSCYSTDLDSSTLEPTSTAATSVEARDCGDDASGDGSDAVCGDEEQLDMTSSGDVAKT